jgi:uridine kinase
METLLAAIEASPPRAGATRAVAIDGRSGAGKSTLAGALAGRLGAPVVGLEDLYGGWDGLEDGVARLLSEVLVPLAEGRPASVPRYDWEADVWTEPRTLQPSAVLIVEGVGAGALAVAPYLSLLVWLELDAGVRRERALSRRPGDAEQWERWAGQEDAYVECERPGERADVVITTGPRASPAS